MLCAEHAVALRPPGGDLGGRVLQQLAGGRRNEGGPGLEARAARGICTHVTAPHQAWLPTLTATRHTPLQQGEPSSYI